MAKITKKMIHKTQEFKDVKIESVYFPEDGVWQSDFCAPNEWSTEREMRRDMRAEYLADGDSYFLDALLDCYDDSDVDQLYDEIYDHINRSE